MLSTTYLSPTPPPGFQLNILWSPDGGILEPRELWQSLVSAQFFLSGFGKNELLTRPLRFDMQVSGASIAVMPPTTRASFDQASYGHMVWALYEIGVQVAHHCPWPQRAPALWTTVTVLRTWVGSVSVMPPSQDQIPPPPTQNVTTARRAISRLSTADSGRVPCREDPNLVISYEFLGRPLAAEQVFTAFLKANTFFSEYDEEAHVDTMVAYSVNRSVRLGVSSLRTDDLTWERARLAVRVLWRQIVMGFVAGPPARWEGDAPRWEGVGFLLEYEGLRIGQGFVA